MPLRDFTTLCNDTMAAPVPIGSRAGEPGIEEITIFELANSVLREQKQEVTIDMLVDKLMKEHIKVASDLL